MKTEKELLKLLKRWEKIDKIYKDWDKKEPEFLREQHKIEKVLAKILRKKKKLPAYIKMEIGNYRISCSVNYGYLKIKEIK